jgi:hypothetical protein
MDSVQLPQRRGWQREWQRNRHSLIMRFWNCTRFLELWLTKNFTPLAPDECIDPTIWLARRPYPLARKAELWKLIDNNINFIVKMPHSRRVKSFVKDERYTEFKFARGIYSRDDEFKVVLGPIVAAIEEKVYKHNAFVKKIPVHLRPAWLEEKFSAGLPVFACDYTSMESSYQMYVMDVCCGTILRYFLSKFLLVNPERLYMQMAKAAFANKIRDPATYGPLYEPPYPGITKLEWLRLCKLVLDDNEPDFLKILTGRNRIMFKWFTAYLFALLQSGEMLTSLLNGVTNFTVILFVFTFLMHGGLMSILVKIIGDMMQWDLKETTDIPIDRIVRPLWPDAAEEERESYKNTVHALRKLFEIQEFPAGIEGDDSLTQPSSDIDPTPKDFEPLGFIVKVEKFQTPEEASFCGNVYAKPDYINVTDPKVVLAEIGWASARHAFSSMKTKKTLARAKGLSYLYQYYGCPVIQSAALYVLRQTAGYDVRHFIANDRSLSEWERTQMFEAIKYSNELDKKKGRDIPIATRLLVESKYGITVEMQQRIESYFDNKDDMSQLELDDYLDFPTDWYVYGSRFVVTEDAPTVALVVRGPG